MTDEEQSRPMNDVVVVGGGMGGLATAALARAWGLRVTLLESHTKLGGCAGWFDRGPYTFDVGATALMGLGAGEPIGDFLNEIGLEFRGVRTPAYRVCMPDRTFEITPDRARFLHDSEESYPGQSQAKRFFWNLQEAVGSTLFKVASAVPRLPVRSLTDIFHDVRVLGLGGILAASTWPLSVANVLRILGLSRDRSFETLVAMLLQDTAQAGPETVPFANAAACIQAYRMGMSRPSGGMRALAEGIGTRFTTLGGILKRATLVDRVEKTKQGHFEVITRRRERIQTRDVVFNLPLDRAADLLGESLQGRLSQLEAQSRAAWSAFTGYLAFRRDAISDASPLFHQVLQNYNAPIHDGNNILISLSPPGDPGYGPESVRVATMSTHVRPEDWANLSRSEHESKKDAYAKKMIEGLGRAIPEAPGAIVHAEFGTPRSFNRYTRRAHGSVGGPPVSRSNSNFLAVGSDALGPGIWLVGDSVFPGQGTMAVVLSGIRVVERLTGRRWKPKHPDLVGALEPNVQSLQRWLNRSSTQNTPESTEVAIAQEAT